MGNPVKPKPKDKHEAHGNASRDPLKALLYSIAERGEHIPREEQEGIPPDFAKNIDHYLYGATKIPE